MTATLGGLIIADLPHWNQEIRLIDLSGREERIIGNGVKIAKHVLPDTPYLDMYCLGPDDKPIHVRTNRDDFRPTR